MNWDAGRVPRVRPDTSGQATDPDAKTLSRWERQYKEMVAGPPSSRSRSYWTATGRLSPKNGRLRPVCRYIGP